MTSIPISITDNFLQNPYNFKEWGLKNNLVTEAELKEIERDIKAKVTESIEFAEQSSEPLAEELWTDVYR